MYAGGGKRKPPTGPHTHTHTRTHTHTHTLYYQFPKLTASLSHSHKPKCTVTRAYAHTHTLKHTSTLNTRQGVDLQHVCEYYRSQDSFPRNLWHKPLLSHYLMTKHSHFLQWLCLILLGRQPSRMYTWHKHTPPEKGSLFPQLKVRTLYGQKSTKIRWLDVPFTNAARTRVIIPCFKVASAPLNGSLYESQHVNIHLWKTFFVQQCVQWCQKYSLLHKPRAWGIMTPNLLPWLKIWLKTQTDQKKQRSHVFNISRYWKPFQIKEMS